MPKNINLTGRAGKTYDLDKIQSQSRTNTDSLVVEIWNWSPELPKDNPHSKPNPPKPKIGRIWMSRLVSSNSPEFQKLLGE